MQAVAIKPDAKVYHALGHLFYLSGNINGAWQYFMNALQVRDHSGTFYLLNWPHIVNRHALPLSWSPSMWTVSSTKGYASILWAALGTLACK
jgi:hypothetical protein